MERGERADAEARLASLGVEALTRPAAAMRLARAERGIGRTREARERLEVAISQNPRDPELRRALAALLSEQGEAEEALHALEQALARAPHYAPVQKDLARALAAQGDDLDRAFELARAAHQSLGPTAEALDTLALVHLRRGDDAEALAAADRALPRARGPVRAHLLYLRAAALAELGRRDEARAAVAEALSSAAAASDGAPAWIREARRLGRRLGVAAGP